MTNLDRHTTLSALLVLLLVVSQVGNIANFTHPK